MKYIFVVEGNTEKYIYKRWVKILHPHLTYSDYYTAIPQDGYAIINGCGMPNIYEVVKTTIEDITDGSIECDKLIIIVDSDELSFDEKSQEVNIVLSVELELVAHSIVIQSSCFESWTLGNPKAIPARPHSKEFQELVAHYNVRKQDPELMPGHSRMGLTKSQLALTYITAALRQKRPGLTYDKNKPSFAAHPKYLSEIQKRLKDTAHLQSFASLLNAIP